TTTSSSSTSSTPFATSLTPPASQTQTGVAANCDLWHLVRSGDTCASIISTGGLQSSDFYAWNPAVGSTCLNLWLNYYACVGVASITTTSSSSTNSASSSSTTTTSSTSTSVSASSKSSSASISSTSSVSSSTSSITGLSSTSRSISSTQSTSQ